MYGTRKWTRYMMMWKCGCCGCNCICVVTIDSSNWSKGLVIREPLVQIISSLCEIIWNKNSPSRYIKFESLGISYYSNVKNNTLYKWTDCEAPSIKVWNKIVTQKSTNRRKWVPISIPPSVRNKTPRWVSIYFVLLSSCFKLAPPSPFFWQISSLFFEKMSLLDFLLNPLGPQPTR